MSEVQSRPAAPRGRGSGRGGRGGFSRGGRGSRGLDKSESFTSTPIEEDGAVGQLKKQYGSKVETIKEMFPDWTDEDVVLALQENDGDLETTVDAITNGTIVQWGEVSTKKDRAKSKAKETTSSALGDVSNGTRGSRGGRGGFEGGRGGRGRGTDRGRGGRGRGGAVTNGSHQENADPVLPAGDSTAWDSGDKAPSWDTAAKSSSDWDTPAKPAEEDASDTAKPADDGWGATAIASSAVAATSSIIPNGVKKSWASIFAPAPAPTPKKAPEPVVEKAPEPEKIEEPSEPSVPEPEEPVAEPTPIETAEPVEAEPEPTPVEEPVTIAPSQDELTEDNLEQVPDVSNPPPTATAASTAASSWDPRNNAGSSTPYSASQAQAQAQTIRPPTSGFQASALKATGASGRSSSYQRRVLDQEEAVRMPGNREVDRAAVQFGAFNLNGSSEEDVDGEREEPETRAQPPQHSPIAPRAALPPAPQQSAPVSVPESLPTPKQPVGLPAATHPIAAPGLPSPAPLASAQATAQQGPHGGNQYGQYGRYNQGGSQDQSSLPHKPYDAFSQQAPSTQSPFEGYPGQQSQSHSQPQSGAFSSAPNDFSSYYTADQGRNAYNNYYAGQQYGMQQGAQGQGQEAASSQQRSYSGYGGPQGETAAQSPQSSAQPSQSRYASAGEGQNSGHSTPNPAAQAQQPGSAPGAQPQPGHQQPQAGSYPYGHPYYSSPYYAAYMNQYQGYGGANYPAGPYGGAKGGAQQPYQGYGMSPAAPYDHATSPAAAGAGGSSLHGRDGTLGGLSEYGRAGHAQSVPSPQALGGSGGAFGGSHDAFGRGSSYQGQSQGHYNGQQSSQPSAGDDLKPFGETKNANGPSPALSQAGRPGSATNAAPGSALPPPQSQATGYGGYPAHLQNPSQGLHANQQSGSQYGSWGGAAGQYGSFGGASGQYGSLGGATGHQAAGQGHQNGQYGGYQAFGGNNHYGQQSQRGGWGGNYGH